MTIPDFALDLGNGIYIDSSGRLTTTPPENIAQFSLAEPLPIPKAAIQDVFGAVGTVLPQIEKIGTALGAKDADFFKSLGMTDDLIKTFGKVANMAATIAAVIPYVNIVVGLLSVFSSFSGSDPLADLIKAEFNRLHARLDETARNNKNAFIAEYLSVFDPAVNSMLDFKSVLAKPKAFRGPDELERKREVLQNQVTIVNTKIGEAIRHPWTLPLPEDAYHDNWGYLQDILHTVPKSGPPAPANFPDEFEPFDHRPMVQMLVYGIHVYLTLIKCVVPEYRTAGQFWFALQQMADNLSDHALDTMREKTLARTIYNSGVPFFRETAHQMFVLAVGAMDLRNDTDDYLRGARQPLDHPEWDRAGNLYRTWTTAPTIDPKGTMTMVPPGSGPVGDVWWTINPVTVKLANEQSERDYAALLMRSGYFTLAHLEALMRHLSTEPDRSETVTAQAETFRKAGTATTVTVKSDDIPFSPTIKATASREPQECKAYLTLTTQQVPNDKAIRYRLRLLTLPNGRTETPFDWYVWTSYDPVTGSRNKKLQVHENSGLPLDPVGQNERLLADHISPLEPITKQDTAKLTADTFDWYIPRPDNPIAFTRILDTVRLKAGAPGGIGGAQPIPMPPPAPSGGGSLVQPFNRASIITSTELGLATFGWDEGTQTWKGEKREWRREEIHVTWKLYWREDELSVVLQARPQDRNYVVYLVVEEQLLESQQWLRTAVRVQFTGQLTYVPQSFFDKEAKAREHANKLIGYVENKYRISRQPGPADPVTGWVRPGVLHSPENMQQFFNLARQHAPEIVEEALRRLGPRGGTAD